MANVLHKTRTPADYRQSVHTPDFPDADWFHNPDVSAVLAVPTKYWRVGTNPVQEMDAAEKAAVDQAEADAATTADRTAAKADIERRLFVALVKVLIDEINILRTRDRDRAADVATALSLADLKTLWALRAELTDRTGAQARNAIKNEIDLI